MKLQFEGSLSEFREVFGHVVSTEDYEGEFEPSDESDFDPPVTPPGKTPLRVVEGESVPAGPPAPVHVPQVMQAPAPPMGAVGPTNRFGIPVPQNDPLVGQALNLPTLSVEDRLLAQEKMREFCVAWAENFGKTTCEVRVDEETGEERTVEVPLPQPDRQGLMEQLGSGGRWPLSILVMGYEIGSLQRLVEQSLKTAGFYDQWQAETGGTESDWLDWINQLSATMVQLSHAGFPDLAGTYDYTTRWRRISPGVKA